MNRLLRKRPTPRLRSAAGVAHARLHAGVWFSVLLALLLVQLAGVGHRVRHPAPQWHAGWQAGAQGVTSQGSLLERAGATAKAPSNASRTAVVSHGSVHDEAQCRLLDALSLGDAGPSVLLPLLLLAAQFESLPAVARSTPRLAAPWRRQARAPPV